MTTDSLIKKWKKKLANYNPDEIGNSRKDYNTLAEVISDLEQLREQKPDIEITDKYIKEEAKHFSEGWGDNDDEKSFIAGYKAALLKTKDNL